MTYNSSVGSCSPQILTNNHLSTDSISQLRRSVLISKHKNHKGESTASTLLRLLEEKEGTNYCYMTGTYSEAENLVRVRKVKKKKVLDDAVFPPVEKDVVEDEVEDSVDEETNNYVRSVVKALTLGDDEVLLAVAFVTKEGKLYHIKFPGVLGFDVKYGTNNEKRPLCRVVGRTANNRNIPIMNCFLPSQQRYVFSWIFNEAIPYLLDRDALLETSIMPTDQDPHEMDALYACLSKHDCHFGDARHVLCKWHKVSEPYPIFVYTYIRIFVNGHFSSHVCSHLLFSLA